MAGKTKHRKSGSEKKVGAVMVVGGGIAGIEASLDLANSGYKVYLVENSPSIGGVMARLDKTFPTNDCSMCILSPKLVECGRHLNIENMTYTKILDVTGEAGNFHVKVNRRSRHIDTNKCTGCGDCVEACPVEWEDEFNAGMGKRKAVYRPFPQAYPNVFTIDKRERGPCATACPGGINIQGFVALIGAGKFKEALGVIRESIPFPSVCGRVCHHPCEDLCKRGEYDTPLSIMALKRFVADKCGEEELHLPEKEETKPHKVAIIGSGPAGLSAAFELAKKGYPVDVFEALPEPGGMLAVGIPDYRLPRDILRKEIERIVKIGVSINTNIRLGKDITISGLREKGYKAILLAIGAHEPLKLGIEGEDLFGVTDCVQFLRDVNLGNKVEVSKKVVVVGGGNAAIDSARVAKRLGKDTEVAILYRRTRREMPANPEEIEEALNEGIDILYLSAPVEATGMEGKLVSMTCRKMKLGAPDESGRRRPIPVQGSDFKIEVDTLISAISQKADFSFAPKLKQTRWGSIETKKDSSETNLPGIYACGDAVSGPNTVIDSIAAGKKAAADIDMTLSKREPADTKPSSRSSRSRNFPEFVEQKARAKIPKIEVHKRINNFSEVEQTLSMEAAVAEAKRCLSCGVCSECMQCVSVCKAEAISHQIEDRIMDINVGAIVLAPGFKEFDAAKKFNLGYSRSKNIVSSMEFERILSASGPFSGHVVRPSDGKAARKIAFIQCVGSRDEKCGNGYCSSVCCMYAVKEAVIAREHKKDVEPTIFYMDMRAFGKDFDKYIERAKSEYGVVFKRSRVFSMEENPHGEVIVSYENENGEFEKEAFDLGVLSIGLEPGDDFAFLAERLRIELNDEGFFKTDTFNPLDSSRPGIYVCGAASGPKDIPETVVQASGASARVGTLLAAERGSLTLTKTYPPEIDVSYQGPRIGVFICHCGINIGGVVNVPAVAEYARTLPNVVYVEENLYTCSQDTQDKIKALIQEHGLNRVIVASCSPRTHEPLFQETIREAGLNRHLFEMANIRDQCSWVHMHDKEAATEKSKDLVRMAVAKVRDAAPLKTALFDMNHEALVVGGGVAGMTAALALADQGFKVHVIEKAKELGGMAKRTRYTIDGRDIRQYLTDLTERVSRHPGIKVHTDTSIVDASGYVGNFTTEVVKHRARTPEKINHGVTIIATGAMEYKPDEYMYSQDKRVVTQLELEEMLSKCGTRNAERGKPKKTPSSEFQIPSSVVMILCAGSRNDERPYCSRLCCNQAIKNCLRLKRANPQMNIYVLYRDMRTYGFSEKYYQEARNMGVVFTRYTPESSPKVKEMRKRRRSLRVEVSDPAFGGELAFDADMVVLSVPIVPRDDAKDLAKLYKVPLNEDNFFLEAHVKLKPVDFATDGVFVCGLAHYPKDIGETISQASAAAGRAAVVLSRDKIEAEAKTSYVREDRCSGCGACVQVCAYNAIELDSETHVAQVNEGVCKGCGACAATCRAGAIDIRGFRDDQILSVLSVLNY